MVAYANLWCPCPCHLSVHANVTLFRYEPPWHQRKAAQQLADDDGDGPFLGHDSPDKLAGIRKRRMEPPEVRVRFEEIR
jgi:hypothetical protein